MSLNFHYIILNLVYMIHVFVIFYLIYIIMVELYFVKTVNKIFRHFKSLFLYKLFFKRKTVYY